MNLERIIMCLVQHSQVKTGQVVFQMNKRPHLPNGCYFLKNRKSSQKFEIRNITTTYRNPRNASLFFTNFLFSQWIFQCTSKELTTVSALQLPFPPLENTVLKELISLKPKHVFLFSILLKSRVLACTISSTQLADNRSRRHVTKWWAWNVVAKASNTLAHSYYTFRCLIE